jgi:hypothetical protein
MLISYQFKLLSQYFGRSHILFSVFCTTCFYEAQNVLHIFERTFQTSCTKCLRISLKTFLIDFELYSEIKESVTLYYYKSKLVYSCMLWHTVTHFGNRRRAREKKHTNIDQLACKFSLVHNVLMLIIKRKKNTVYYT